MSYTRAPKRLRCALSAAAITLTLVCSGQAQPYGFLTPIPAKSFIRGVSVPGNHNSDFFNLPQQGLVSGVLVNAAGTLLYTASQVSATSGAEIAVTALPAHTLVATIPLTFTPYSLVLAPNGATLYVAGTASFTSASIAVINTALNTVTTTLTANVTPDPNAAFPAAITPDGSSLYLAAGGLVRVNTATLAVLVYAAPGSFSQGIAITPDGKRLWFGLNNTIQVRNAQTLTLITTISAAGSPFGGNGILITPDGSEAILANNGIRVFDTSTFLMTASVTKAPFLQLGYLAPGPNAGSFLVTNTYSSQVLLVSTTLTLLSSYPQGGAATASVALPGGTEVLAANSNVTAVGTINAASGVLGPALPLGCQAGTPALNTARTHLYVPARCSQEIAELEFGGALTGRLLHGPVFATKVLASPDESLIYAADLSGIKYSDAGTIEVLNGATGALVQSLTGGLTVDLALSADGSQLYVDDNGSSGSGFDCPIGGICVFDTSTFTLSAQIPNVFGSLAASQDGNSLYAGPEGTFFTAINTSNFGQTQISLPIALSSVGSVAVSPMGNVAMVVGNGPSGGVGFVLNTTTNQITGEFPVPSAFLTAAAFAPDGNSIWFLSGQAPSMTLVQMSYPAGLVLTQTPAQGTSITFNAPF